MSLVDIYLSKQISDASNYYQSPLIIKRYNYPDDKLAEDNIILSLREFYSELNELVIENDEVAGYIDQVRDIIEDEIDDSVAAFKSINNYFDLMDLSGYNFRLVLRSNLENPEVTDNSRSYALIDDPIIPGFKYFTEGLSLVYTEDTKLNSVSMVMDYIDQDLISFTSDQEIALNLIETLKEYKYLEERGESFLMNIEHLRYYLESNGYKFVAIINAGPVI